MANPLLLERIWFDKYKIEDCESAYEKKLHGVSTEVPGIVGEIQQIRKQIQSKLEHSSDSPALNPEAMNRIAALEAENKKLRQTTDNLSGLVSKLEARIKALEVGGIAEPAKGEKKSVPAESEESDSDDGDLFGSDDEDNEELERIKAERLAAYKEKKAQKPALIAKSSVILDVKPYGDETDMAEMERLVRSIEIDGLNWGGAKLVPVGYGINKLQIICVVEDDKVSVEELQERIADDFEDHVQSVDIAAFNKI